MRFAVQVILVLGQYHSRLQIVVSLHELSDYCQCSVICASIIYGITTVQEAINPHDHGSILLVNNFLMPHGSSLQFDMCTGWDLIVLEILRIHVCTVF